MVNEIYVVADKCCINKPYRLNRAIAVDIECHCLSLCYHFPLKNNNKNVSTLFQGHQIYQSKNTHLILFNKSDECCSFNFNWLTRSVIQCDNEMKEIRFSQITRWLFFEICSTYSEAERKKYSLITYSKSLTICD